MKYNTYGNNFSITTFGESRSPAVGVVIDGIKPGLEFNLEILKDELSKRRPGKGEFSSPRVENDDFKILSGVFEGKTLGTPIAIVIENREHSGEGYEKIKNLFRPGHAGFTWLKKYGIRDWRGGGRSSGRETVARVAGGSVAKMILNENNIGILSYASEIAGIRAEKVDFKYSQNSELKFCDPEKSDLLNKKLHEIKNKHDSAGGVVTTIIKGVPPGIGDPVFEKLTAKLAFGIMSIGGIKGVEFGSGFDSAGMTGSTHNDEMDSKGFTSNNAGGILGGISSGQDIVIRSAIKPVSSIAIAQNTVDLQGNKHKIATKGKHDILLIPRIIPVIESMIAITLVDSIISQNIILNKPPKLSELRNEIEKIDISLISQLSKRMEIVREISKLKKNESHPIFDSEREKYLEELWKKLSTDLNISPQFSLKILKLILSESKAMQSE